MTFKLQYDDTKSNARASLTTIDHGVTETSIFMSVDMQGMIEGARIAELKEDTKTQIILGNTHHPYLRPGIQILEQTGGLHKFNIWDRPILTDSGGFRVFSPSDNRKLHKEEAELYSHLDSSKHVFTPEKVTNIERFTGMDIIMAFDGCHPGDTGYNYAGQSLGLTERWLGRYSACFSSTESKYGHRQGLFSIVQGRAYTDLRQRTAENVVRKGADENAIGGLAVGKPTDKTYRMIEVINDILSKDKSRYLIGIDTPISLLKEIERGIDISDCIMPTHNGCSGQLFARFGTVDMRNKRWKNDSSPVDPGEHSYVNTLYSKAYLHHPIKAKRMLGLQIASIHNLAFYLWLVKGTRAHITAGDFTAWKSGIVCQLTNRLQKTRQMKLKLKRIDWYIIKQFLDTYAFAIALIIFISVVLDINEEIGEFLNLDVPLKAIIVDYYLNFIPCFASLFGLLFTFIATIFFTSKLADHSEIIAMLASGMSFRRSMLFCATSATTIAIVTSILNTYVIPPTNETRIDFQSEYIRNKKMDCVENAQLGIEPGVIAYFGNYDARSDIGYRFSLGHSGNKKLISRLTTKSIKCDSFYQRTVTDYMIRDLDGIQEHIFQSSRKNTVLTITPSDFLTSVSDCEMMTTPELNTYINRQKRRGIGDTQTFRIEYHERFATIMAAFILTSIRASLLSRKIKENIGMNIGIGLALSFFYILFMTITSTFAINDYVSPTVTAWISNTVYIFIAMFLYQKASR